MSTLQERIKEALKKANMKPVELAKLAGVERATVSLWINGPTKTIEGDNLTRAARALNEDAHWLATGERRQSKNATQAAETNPSLEYRMLQKFANLTEEDKDRTIAIMDVFLKHERVRRDTR